MTGFDTVAMVDWSAASRPSPARPSKDAIWLGMARRGAPFAPSYFRTRRAAEAALAGLITAERAAGRRLLLGFDFPFGYPAGLARALTGSDDPFAVWNWLAARITDNLRNRNNRFDVASAMNRVLPGAGPFWGKTHADRWPDIPYRKAGITYDAIPEKRSCDRVARTSSSCFQLCYNPTVGSQVLMGLPMLNRLRRLPGVAIWPFEDCATAPVVLAEIWPGLIENAVRTATRADPEAIRDAVQVTRLATVLSRLPPSELAAMMRDLPDAAREEAWILGATARDRLTALAQDCGASYLETERQMRTIA
ncbi:molybdopterin guanine dinucleotide synthesis [Roseovarius sp. SCSIO 43702]|uniref:molybdopterin guanine dinucleotide synthesis n=1 Tax=Roseovarius sp. SCSIO 43702 TaxID=2823043 RepID=UPI001C7309BC|nr:molybdopterin guanine dinucleotide synthesis [Roseovarius sp. SCSIO 43702]QYX55828.1 molybdopterin guanine dinucleotide synthesis [Roseovarius sp. SCSIO 43702]